ncbi:uncharacterized protein LOC125823596 [Solanum verrucosum]|uniref:uncharacterized protein LOC125823596 n=1 Tax=Solanum verrucosum TaxID=315347 RepID=UPI0020D023BA|nr:uncharacterized protein LOC125823596 [Solanum verrucosum]
MPTEEATSMAENEVTSLNHNHPLYLQASDAPGVILVLIKLTGPENYAMWCRSMKLALRGKGKLGFVDGSCRKTAFKGVLEEQWKKCNAIELSWIASTVTSELLPGIIYASNAKRVWEDFKERVLTLYVTSYYSKLRDLWAELDVMIPSPCCNFEDSTAYMGHLRSHRLLQFLMGLNESFSSIRSNIVAQKPVVTVNEAYAVAAQESQRALGVSERTRDYLTLLAGKAQTCTPSQRSHYKIDCYKLEGYPPGFQSKRNGIDGYKNDYKVAEGFRPDFKPNAHFTKNADDFNDRGKQVEGAHFTRNVDYFNDRGKQVEGHMTPPQYQDLVNRMDRAETSDCVANMSGMSSLNSKPGRVYEWIIDSGDTHHIIPNKELLTAIKRIQGNNSDGVQVPTGSRCDIKGIGTAQGLYDGKVLGIGKEREGLYILKKQIQSPVQAMATANMSRDATLWHLRLGHASTGILQLIQSLKHLSNKNIQHELLKDFIALIKNQFGLPVKTLRSDNGSEFFNSSVNNLLASQGIIHQSSCAYSSQQNGKVERKHRHILEMARALRFQSSLPIYFWGYVTFRESTFPYQAEPVKSTSTDLDMFELQNSDYLSTSLINSSDHPNECNTTHIPDPIIETSPASILEDIPTINALPSLQPTEELLQITYQSKSRPSRTIKPPGWLNNYITTSKAKPPSSTMTDELCALESNHTWEVVDLPPGKQAIGSKWVFKIKHKVVDKYKARLVAKGYTQNEGLDYHETFSPVAKMITVRTLISVAASKDWSLIQMDVNNAFLQGDLHEEVYMSLPQGFYRQGKTRVCKLLKSLYGLKQASRQWNIKLSTALLEAGCIQSSHDYSLFTKHCGNDIVVILVYVNDLMITRNSQQLIDDGQKTLHSKFKVKDLGQLRYFLGIEVLRSEKEILLNQRKYILELLSTVRITGAKPASTPMEMNVKLTTLEYDSVVGSVEDPVLSDIHSYQ